MKSKLAVTIILPLLLSGYTHAQMVEEDPDFYSEDENTFYSGDQINPEILSNEQTATDIESNSPAFEPSNETDPFNHSMSEPDDLERNNVDQE
jgi:hypothetical protein